MFTFCMPFCKTSNPKEEHQPNPDIKIVKSGYLARYRSNFCYAKWSKEWVALYEDSTLSWYSVKCLSKPKGSIRIADAPEYFAVGEWTRMAPEKPYCFRYNYGQLLAIGSNHKGQEVHWFAAISPAETNDWLTAISNTLPPPPKPLTETEVSKENHIETNKNLQKSSKQTKLNITEKRCQCFQPPPSQQKNRMYDADYTPLSAACIDWGHGWGWGQNTFQDACLYHQDLATITHTAANYIDLPQMEDCSYCYSGLEDASVGDVVLGIGSLVF